MPQSLFEHFYYQSPCVECAETHEMTHGCSTSSYSYSMTKEEQAIHFIKSCFMSPVFRADHKDEVNSIRYYNVDRSVVNAEWVDKRCPNFKKLLRCGFPIQIKKYSEFRYLNPNKDAWRIKRYKKRICQKALCSKNVCLKCEKRNKDVFDKNWDNFGVVACRNTTREDFCRFNSGLKYHALAFHHVLLQPSERCPYYLEHLVARGDRWQK